MTAMRTMKAKSAKKAMTAMRTMKAKSAKRVMTAERVRWVRRRKSRYNRRGIGVAGA